ncbi:hypothetical protein [Ralstonia pseudosolanacearum]|uniref:hypothetical protein n=1 Tax=Ralstonia pseudosolanacearum TaxID=1310165 RepID=UPI0018D164BA|nr:hypothetical protein [Ralstonia pseudosolanacearum]
MPHANPPDTATDGLPVPPGMTRDTLHAFLTRRFDLVTDPAERGSGRAYFLGTVVWHPASATRILHVTCGADGQVSHIKLCDASDNNHSVFVPLPVSWPERHRIVADEIARYGRRSAARQARDHSHVD